MEGESFRPRFDATLLYIRHVCIQKLSAGLEVGHFTTHELIFQKGVVIRSGKPAYHNDQRRGYTQYVRPDSKSYIGSTIDATASGKQ